MSTTTKSLKERIFIKTTRCIEDKELAREGQVSDSVKGAFRKGVRLCTERARLVTESYRETEGEPMVIRRAKALEKILENMTIYINDGECIVGNFASDSASVNSYPEISCKWLDTALEGEFKDLADEDKKNELREIHKYWEGKTLEERIRSSLPHEAIEYLEYNGAVGSVAHRSLAPPVPNYERAFALGLKGIIRQAEEKLDNLQERIEGLSPKDYVEQRNFLEALIISCNAEINFSRRYAKKARELAEIEVDSERKGELEEIAGVCDRVPENPPESLREALQFFYFIHLIIHQIELPGQGLGVRFDQVMDPFYQKDKSEGKITREKAQELLEFLWIKLEEHGHLSDPYLAKIRTGTSLFQTLMIGGVTPEGKDATNEMSYLIIDATKEIRTIQPSLALRYHPRIPPDLILKAIDLIRTGHGMPAFYNDQTIIPCLLKRGIKPEDARNYTMACVQWQIPGKVLGNKISRPGGGFLNLGKCLEFVLYQGEDKYTRQKLGYPTRDPNTMSNIDEVMEAYLKQISFLTEKLVIIDNISEYVYAQYMPRPFLSALLDDCLEKGKDATTWSYYSYPTIAVMGNTNVADSITAIAKFAFDDKKISMKELVEACKTNFEGREDLRQRLINEAPKFGNDDDYADYWAREVQERTEREFEKFPDYYGVPYCIDGSSAGTYYYYSVATGATPDGRKDSESFADGVLSPAAGRDKKGPTAALASTSKIDPLLTFNLLLNQKFMPQYLEGENRKIFADYLKTWADLGHWHIQFNVVDKNLLLEAQKHPEQHTNLVVRVAGYSSYFVDLSKGLQDNIIDRTEQGF